MSKTLLAWLLLSVVCLGVFLAQTTASDTDKDPYDKAEPEVSACAVQWYVVTTLSLVRTTATARRSALINQHGKLPRVLIPS